MARLRGIVLDSKTIVLVDKRAIGRRAAPSDGVQVFEVEDPRLLDDEGIASGDVVSFVIDDVDYVVMATKVKPTAAELAKLEAAAAKLERARGAAGRRRT